MTYQSTYRSVEREIAEDVKVIFIFAFLLVSFVFGGLIYHSYTLDKCKEFAMQRNYSPEEIKKICGDQL